MRSLALPLLAAALALLAPPQAFGVRLLKAPRGRPPPPPPKQKPLKDEDILKAALAPTPGDARLVGVADAFDAEKSDLDGFLDAEILPGNTLYVCGISLRALSYGPPAFADPASTARNTVQQVADGGCIRSSWCACSEMGFKISKGDCANDQSWRGKKLNGSTRCVWDGSKCTANNDALGGALKSYRLKSSIRITVLLSGLRWSPGLGAHAIKLFAQRFATCDDPRIYASKGATPEFSIIISGADDAKVASVAGIGAFRRAVSPAHVYEFSATFPDGDATNTKSGWHVGQSQGQEPQRLTRRCALSLADYALCAGAGPGCRCTVPLKGLHGLAELRVRVLRGKDVVATVPSLDDMSLPDNELLDDAGQKGIVERVYLAKTCGASPAKCDGPWKCDFSCDRADPPLNVSEFARAMPDDVALGIEFEFSGLAPDNKTEFDAMRCVESRFASDPDLKRWNVFKEDVAETKTHHHGIELTSAAPPFALTGVSGAEQIVRVSRLMQQFGVAAPLQTGLHVHVNVFRKDALPRGARTLEPRQVGAVVLNWIRWQVAVSSLTPPSRRWNFWAVPAHRRLPATRRLYESARAAVLGDSGVNCTSSGCSVSGAIETLIHEGNKGSALNLLRLTSYGTLEIRQQAGTHSQTDAVAWAAFVGAFVYGMSSLESVHPFVSTASSDDGWKLLSAAQRTNFGSAGRGALVEALGLGETSLGGYLKGGGMGSCDAE